MINDIAYGNVRTIRVFEKKVYNYIDEQKA